MAHSTADPWLSQGQKDTGFNAAALPGFVSEPSIPSPEELKSDATDDIETRPSPPSVNTSLGHSSSDSFARTVSHEITWAQDDAIDPAWGLSPKETDTFRFIGEHERSNSFPEVLPAHPPPSDKRASLYSDLKEVGSDTEDPHHQFDINGGYGSDSLPEIQPDIQAEKPSTFLSPTEDSAGGNFFENLGTSQGGYTSSPPDDEARYEEGVPLVPSDNHPRAHQRSESVDFFGDSPYSPSDNFFSDISQQRTESAPIRPTLDRKSTTQVLGSLDYSSHDKTDHKAEGDGNSKTSSHALENGKRLESTDDYHTLNRSQGTDVNEDEEDLAAKWKAALDDEEFLDDDETPTADPSSYFAGDEDGFLDDEPATAFLNGSAQGQGDVKSANLAQRSQQFNPAPFSTADKYAPGSAFQHARYQAELTSSHPMNPIQQFPNQLSQYQQGSLPAQASPYAPPNLSRSMSQPVSATSFGVPPPYTPGFQPQQQQPPSQRPEPPKAQSYSDKAKGGYSSPYDLPMDVVRPRKRASMQQMGVGVGRNAPIQPPPPRSSSMYGAPPSSQYSPQVTGPPSTGSASSLSPPQSSHSFQAPSTAQSAVAPAAVIPPSKPKTSSGSFFEELPITTKPKQISGHGRYTPQPVTTPPPFQAPPTAPLSAPLLQQGFNRALPPQTQTTQGPTLAHQMLPPERVNPYAAVSGSGPVLPAATVAASRYSPAPAPRVGNLQGHGRYAAPPASAPPQSTGALAHQPRTSSPLAQMEISPKMAPPLKKPQQQETYARPSSQGVTARSVSNLGGVPREEEEMEYEVGQPQAHQPPPAGATGRYAPARTTATPPPPRTIPGNTFSSPSKRSTSNYMPQYQPSGPAADPSFAPPRRAQTQSPGAAIAGPKLSITSREPFPRPSSVHGLVSPTSLAPMGHARQFSQSLNYVTPTDGRENDPLQRWRGCPIFVWGFGGTIVTSFPKEVPRYSSAQTMPSIVRNPGEVKIKSAKDVLPLEDRIAKFPGPLRAKGKKKEAMTWLTESIESQEQEAGGLGYGSITTESRKRSDERVILWKLLRTLIERDGVLEGNSEIEKAVRSILIPEVEEDVGTTQPIYSSALTDSARAIPATVHADAVDPTALDALRKDLLKGDREKAVWHAVDKRLWGHAMLIASTCNKELWKQVIQEFVRQEVKTVGQNAESLAALYEIFAGNWEDSIDELVPPSARAGLQMVSTSATTGATRNSLEGLDKWKDTLALVLSNRSADDEQALLALGRLLAGYGRIEAAHICYMFVRAYPAFGGPEEPQTSFALLGADHIQQPVDFAGNLEAILLSETYEFAASLAPSGHGSPAPHLQAYKLYHAIVLADYGYRNEAQAYCTAIANGIKSTTKTSAYYHHGLFSILDDLSNRLQQSPKDSPGSWISKPSMEKVSGSMWAKFNSFVAGDDSDAASTGSGKEGPEIGPFARIAGDTPSVSRSGSVADLYGAYNAPESGPVSGLLSPSKNSRYAPKKSYEPQAPTSQDLQRANSLPLRSSTELQRGPYEPLQPSSSGYSGYEPSQSRDFTPPKPPQSVYQPTSQPASYGNVMQQVSDQAPRSAPAPQSPYSMAMNSSGPTSSLYQPSTNPYQPTSSYQPTPPLEQSRSFGEYEPQQPASGNETPDATGMNGESSSGYEPPQYDPPQYSGYEPPSSSEPYNDGQSDNSSPTQEKPKKKSFMDDDDDDGFAARAAALLKKEKEEKEKEEKQKTANGKQEGSGEKKGWFGGWFGKKDPNAQSGPIKAKLGEESSFYYDPELKRWVNKKAGATTSTPTATPPPPRSGAGRSVSGPPGGPSAPPPSAPPTSFPRPPPVSTASAPPTAPPSSVNGMGAKLDVPPPSRSPSIPGTPQRADSPSHNGPAATLAPPTAFSALSGGSSAPPSRPGTALSNASSIDDLLGPPGQARKAGVAKKGKAKRGYVDVMAK